METLVCVDEFICHLLQNLIGGERRMHSHKYNRTFCSGCVRLGVELTAFLTLHESAQTNCIDVRFCPLLELSRIGKALGYVLADDLYIHVLKECYDHLRELVTGDFVVGLEQKLAALIVAVNDSCVNCPCEGFRIPFVILGIREFKVRLCCRGACERPKHLSELSSCKLALRYKGRRCHTVHKAVCVYILNRVCIPLAVLNVGKRKSIRIICCRVFRVYCCH